MARETKGAFLGGDERVNQNRNRIESNRISGRQKVVTSSAIRPPSKLKELVLFLIISSSV